MTKNRDEQRRLYVLEHAPVEYLKEARAMLARPEKFSAEAIVDALKRTAKFSPKGRTPATSTEPVADDRQALFAAGGTSAAELLGKNAPDNIPQAFHDQPASSFNPALYQAGAKAALELEALMAEHPLMLDQAQPRIFETDYVGVKYTAGKRSPAVEHFNTPSEANAWART